MRPLTRTTARCAGAAVLAAALTVAAAPAGPAAQERERQQLPPPHHAQEPDWGDCALGPDDEEGRELDAAGIRCAGITVPLDHADPHGPVLTVAVSRRAADPGRSLGPLFINGGGPAGTALEMPLETAEAMGEDLAGQFDLIGMDPRFVGRSTPLDCGWPTGTSLRSAGPDLPGYLRGAAYQAELAARCQATNAELLPHVTTRETARDMDLIRKALGADQLHYLGYSYGSYLGEVYSQLFPGRTGRMVLDGITDPAAYGGNLLKNSTAANEQALDDWTAWAAERHAAYGLGATAAEVRATVDRILRAAEREPLRIGSHRLDGHTAPMIYIMGLGHAQDEARAALAADTQVLARAADRLPVRPHPGLAEAVEFLVTGQESAYGSAQAAIICGDVAVDRDPLAYWRTIERARAQYPFAAPVAANITPCAFWPEPKEPPTVVDNDMPALLVAATGDPRASYDAALAVRELWPASRLLTLEGANHHGVYGEYGSECVDEAVNDYLRTGRLPEDDLSCPA
jgi:pimeloyl-ACP methyl ester carboxylesterase